MLIAGAEREYEDDLTYVLPTVYIVQEGHALLIGIVDPLQIVKIGPIFNLPATNFRHSPAAFAATFAATLENYSLKYLVQGPFTT